MVQPGESNPRGLNQQGIPGDSTVSSPSSSNVRLVPSLDLSVSMNRSSSPEPKTGIFSRLWSAIGFSNGGEQVKSNPPSPKEKDSGSPKGIAERDSGFFSPGTDSQEEKFSLGPQIIKTYKAAEEAPILGGWISLLGSYVVPVATNWFSLDNDTLFEEQKQIMLEQLGDPQFVEFYEMLSQTLSPIAEDFIRKDLRESTDPLLKEIGNRPEYAGKLVKIILARGFGNLARQVKENESRIPNFNNQPALVSALSFICQSGAGSIDSEKLKDLERRSEEAQRKIFVATDILFPGIKEKSEENKSLNLYIKEYIKSTDEKRKDDIIKELSSVIDAEKDDLMDSLNEFTKALSILNNNYKEKKEIFYQLTEKILLNIFPGRFSEVLEFGMLSSFLGAKAFNSLKNVIAGVIVDSYSSIENNSFRNQVWEGELKTRLGLDLASNLQPLIEAPSALLVAFAKRFVYTDPRMMQRAVNLIDQLKAPSDATLIKNYLIDIKHAIPGEERRDERDAIDRFLVELEKVGTDRQDLTSLSASRWIPKPTRQPRYNRKITEMITPLNDAIDLLIERQRNQELNTRDNLFNRLSKEQLANWLVKSVQILLSGEDQTFSSFGLFGKQIFDNLTLSLMTKGAKLVIPEGQVVGQGDFIREFSDRLIAKLNGTEQITPETLQAFVQGVIEDLPLPPPVKSYLMPILSDAIIGLKSEVEKKANDFTIFKTMHQEAYRRINAMQDGASLIQMTDAISEQVIDYLLQKNGELINEFGLEDTFEQLFIEYLPGVKINSELKDWLRINVSNLKGVNNQNRSETTRLLKEGLQAIMLKSFADTIDRNFNGVNGNGNDFIKQLLNSVRDSFSTSFAHFTPLQRAQIDGALVTQAQIDQEMERLKEAREAIANAPRGNITPEEESLIEAVLVSEKLKDYTFNTIENLKREKDSMLSGLDQTKRDLLESSNLTQLNYALLVRKNERPLFNTDQDYRNHLIQEVGSFNDRVANGSPLSDKEQAIPLIKMLNSMTNNELVTVSEILNIKTTLLHAEEEFNLLENDFHQKQTTVTTYRPEAQGSPAEWDIAKDRLALIRLKNSEIKTLLLRINDLNEQLDHNLEPFQRLSEKLTGLLGLDDAGKQSFPVAIQEIVWPFVESAQKTHIARLLFKELSPIVILMVDRDNNKQELDRLANQDPLFAGLIKSVSEEIIREIPLVVTPQIVDSMVDSLSQYLPINQNLKTLIKTQVQNEIQRNDSFLNENHLLSAQIVEAALLRICVKIAQENQKHPLNGQQTDSLTLITEKLMILINDPISTPQGNEDSNSVARRMIDIVLNEVFFMTSEKEVDFLPPSLRKLVYDNIKKQAHLQLTPFLLPMIERNQDRATLDAASGSPFMGNLCKALANDLPKLVPTFTAGDVIDQQIAKFGTMLSQAQKDSLTQHLKTLITDKPELFKNISNVAAVYVEGLLLKVFIQIAEKNPPSAGKDSTLVLTENLLAIVERVYSKAKATKNFDAIAQELNDEIIQNLLGIELEEDEQGLGRLFSEDRVKAFSGLPLALQEWTYDAIKDQIGQMVEGIQNHLKTATDENISVVGLKDFDKQTSVSKGNLGILARDIAQMVVDSVPATLSEKIGAEMKGVISISRGTESYLKELVSKKSEVASLLLSYSGIDQIKGLTEGVLTQLNSEPSLNSDKEKVVELVGNVLLRPLSRVVSSAIHFEEKHQEKFNQKLMGTILELTAQHLEYVNDARRAAAKNGTGVAYQDFITAVANKGGKLHPALPVKPLHYQATLDALKGLLYQNHQLSPEQEKEIRKVIITLVTKEFKGEQFINLDEFITVLDPIHVRITGNPLTDAEKDLLKKANGDGFTLRDIMRKDSQEGVNQRRKEAYDGQIENLLKLLLPRGEKDLEFVPENLRKVVWDQLKDNLFPILLPMMTELLLDPAMINTIVINSLETMNTTLGEKIERSQEMADAQTEEEKLLEKVAGDLIKQSLLAATTLPEWAKKLVIGSDGKVNPFIVKSLGNTLRSQFNHTFIKDKIEIALKSAVNRDKEGNATLKFDKRAPSIKAAEASRLPAEQEKKLKKVFRETIKVSILYYFRSQWAALKFKIEDRIKEGKFGANLEKYLIAAFELIFIKIIGTVLYYVTYPLRLVLEEVILEWILKLDENRKNILKIFSDLPSDQPEGETKAYGVYHEDLLFKVVDALTKTVAESIAEANIVPVAADSDDDSDTDSDDESDDGSI